MSLQSRSGLIYKSQILRSGEFKFGDRNFTASEVIDILSPQLTPERIRRIDQVIENRTYSTAVVVENLYDIGNISAVMRSAESFGFMPFHIVERPDAKYKMSDRISRGSEKWLDIHKENDPKVCFDKLRAEGFKIFATDLKASHKIEDIDFSEKVAVVLGNERDGVSDYVRESADGTFILPMLGFAQSFNISVAAALCFQHIYRDKKARADEKTKAGDLTVSEKEILKAHYFLRTLDSASAILERK